LGITSVIKPIPINSSANFDIFICLTATLFLFSAIFIGKKYKLERWQGVFFLLAYIIYVIFLIKRG